MTTRYHLPEGATSASADGIHFQADENGQIDVTGAHPTTVATLVQFAGARPVRSEEDLAQEAADAAEKIRFEAAVAEMMKGNQTIAQTQAAGVQAAADLAAAAQTARDEAAQAERTLREAMVAAAEVEAVTPPQPADGEATTNAAEDTEQLDSAAPVGVFPPKRSSRKNG